LVIHLKIIKIFLCQQKQKQIQNKNNRNKYAPYSTTTKKGISFYLIIQIFKERLLSKSLSFIYIEQHLFRYYQQSFQTQIQTPIKNITLLL